MALGQFTGNVVFAADVTKDVDISSQIADATKAVLSLFDSLGNQLAYQMQAISVTTIRITSEIPVTGTLLLVAIGPGVIVPPTPAATAPSVSPPSLAVFGTYAEARQKLEVDLDLLDETFITPNELIGYFNEGIEEAESDILKIDEDYFLTSAPIPLVTGQSQYSYPPNIYGYKVRGIEYSNGSIIYPVTRLRRRNKFDKLALSLQYDQADDYQWYPTNESAGNAKINLFPPARETAVLSPSASPFTPMTIWFIRRANRIPLLGQYVLNWDIVNQLTGIDTTLNRITVANSYVTGDTVKISSSNTMPTNLVSGTIYYVIAGSGFIKLATTLQNALSGTAISLPSTGTGILYIAIAANQSIVDNTIIDIPEFLKFVIQWVKCRCFEKEGDPRLSGATDTLTQQRGQMVSTLTEAQPDDANTIEADMSAYYDMS